MVVNTITISNYSIIELVYMVLTAVLWGGSFVGLLAARQNIHMDYGILGSSDLDQSPVAAAKLQTALLLPLLYPFIRDGKFKSRILQKKLQKRMGQTEAYVQAFMDMLGGGRPYVTMESCKNQFYSDLITPLPDQINVPGTEIHIFYALKMGKKYRLRYLRHFDHPVIHEQELRHEELLACYPEQWAALVKQIVMVEDKKVIIGSAHFVFEDEGCCIPEGEQEKYDALPAAYSHLYLCIDGELAAVIYHSLAQCYAGTAEEIEALTGKQYPEIHIVGGGANAQYLNRLTAEYTGKTVEAGPTEATALGNLAVQMIAAGEFEDLSAARACIADSFTMEKFEGEKGETR